MTSEERQTMVERAFQAINRRDRVALGEMIDTDFEFHSVFAALEGGAVFRGTDGMGELFAGLDSAWEDLTWHLDTVRDADDKTLIWFHVEGRARTSGVPLDQRAAMVWTWRDGKVGRAQTYTDPQEALEAAGLAE